MASKSGPVKTGPTRPVAPPLLYAELELTIVATIENPADLWT